MGEEEEENEERDVALWKVMFSMQEIIISSVNTMFFMCVHFSRKFFDLQVFPGDLKLMLKC